MIAVKPIMHFQVLMLRMWAESIETFAGNYEKGFEEAATIDHQPDKDRAVPSRAPSRDKSLTIYGSLWSWLFSGKSDAELFVPTADVASKWN